MRLKLWLLLIGGLWLVAGCAGAPPTNRDTAASTTPHAQNSNGLQGKLFYLRLQPDAQDLIRRDLATGAETTLFTVPDNAWISHMDVDPGGNQAVLAYAPPPPEGQIQFGYTDLYLLLADGSSPPRPLIERVHADEVYFNPVWTPDGETIYFSHVEPVDEEAYTFQTNLKRLHLPSGEVTLVAENGIWPRLSPDGRLLAYVSVDPQTRENSLVVSDVNGKNHEELVPMGQFTAVDAPLFAPDGQTLYFSAATDDTMSALPWWNRLLGVKTAAAHTLPSDWFRVPLNGGEPERLTELEAVGLYGDFVADGRSLLFASQAGIYTMQPDGSGLEELLDVSAGDSLSWVDS